MAIYFGNLDRELADRQNVLKEDAARQYRGVRDMRQSFGSLGTTVSSTIKDVAQAKLDRAKLEYNMSRNEEADEIRAEQHSQATQRNRELSLDSTLKNIGRFRKSSIEDYIGRLWFWRDPKTVRASYAERMKIFTADKDTLDPAQRIKMYPHLFGSKAKKKLGIYNLLLQQKKDGITTPDKDIQKALDDLPLTPMNFMDWARDTGMYNTKMKGINPTKISNAMQRAALIEAGYNIPDPEKIFKEASATTASLTDASVTSGTIAEGVGEDVTSDPADITEKEARQKLENLGIDSGVGGVVNIDGTTYSLGGGGPVDSAATDTSTITGGEYQGGTVDVDGTTYSLSGDGVVDSGTGNLSAEQAAATEVVGDATTGEVETLSDQQLSEETQNAVEQLTTVDEDALRYQKYHRQAMKSPGYPGRANPFKVAAEIVAPSVTDTITSSLYGSDRIQEAADRLNQQNKAIGAEVKKKMESRDREELAALRGAVDYKDLPAYKETDSWITLSPEEKSKLLKHPAVQVQGASPEKVFAFSKAKEALSDKDEEIFQLHGPLKKYSPLKDPGSSFNKMAVPVSKYGGKAGADVELISLVEKYNAMMPLRMEERKKLLAKFNKAERSMDASKTKAGINESPMYLGAETTDNQLQSTYGSTSDYGVSPVPMRPKVISEDVGNEMGRPMSTTSTDPGYQAAIDANYAEDTQEEIISGIIDREGYGLKNAGYSYYDGADPDEKGYYKKDGGESLTLAGGNNIYGTINTMSGNERKEAIKEITDGLFGEGNSGERPYITRGELLRFLNMPKKDHKKVYVTAVNRGRLRLTKPQMKFLTGFSYRNHLERMVKHHPYLSGIAQYPKEMQVFLMDNAFNMGPRWLKDKFTKTEKHLRRWVKTRLPSDLEKMKKEYKNSDHYRETTRAKDLIAMLG